MEPNKIKRLAAALLKVGEKRVRITDTEQVAEAITRDDVRRLIVKGVIYAKPKIGGSRGRIRKQKKQRKRGRRSGRGKRKGSKKVREKKKKKWMGKVRAQRKKLRKLKPAKYRKVYKMVKAGYFKSVKHLESVVGGKE